MVNRVFAVLVFVNARVNVLSCQEQGTRGSDVQNRTSCYDVRCCGVIY